MGTIGFGFWNWIALILYLLIMLGVGAYFTKRAGKDTDSFLKPVAVYRHGSLDFLFMRQL